MKSLVNSLVSCLAALTYNESVVSSKLSFVIIRNFGCSCLLILLSKTKYKKGVFINSMGKIFVRFVIVLSP